MKQRYLIPAGFSALMAVAPGTAAIAQDGGTLPLLDGGFDLNDNGDDHIRVAAVFPSAQGKSAAPITPLTLSAEKITIQPAEQSLNSVLKPNAPYGAALAATTINAPDAKSTAIQASTAKIASKTEFSDGLPGGINRQITAPIVTPKTTNALQPATAGQPACDVNGCKIKVTPAKLLQMAESFIANRDFKRAAPLVEALGMSPEHKFQHMFLTGYIQVETGKLKEAEGTFRSLLNADPGQTRIRLELARVLTMRGKEGAANYHFRLAEQADDLPEDIRRAVTGVRSILRSKRNWRLGVDVGFAPDTNINNATSAETVDINFGPIQLPLALNDDARQQSGIGQTAGINAGLRLRTGKKMAVLFDFNSHLVNYKGKAADDFQLNLAIGPEMRLGDTTSISLQALGHQRWYAGRRANTDFGARIGLQKILGEGQRVALSIDGRNTNSGFNRDYSGWSVGGSANYERVIAKSFIASAGIFGRRAELNSDIFSNSSFGVNAGVGGELPLGINAGINGSVSRAKYDAPQLIYSTERRKDWRMFGRAYVGMRSIRFLGFSPSAEYNFSKVSSNYTLNRSNRHRLQFKLARYF